MITFEDIFKLQRKYVSQEQTRQAYIDFWSSNIGRIVMHDLLSVFDPFDNLFDENPINMARYNGQAEPIKYLLSKIKYLDVESDSNSLNTATVDSE